MLFEVDLALIEPWLDHQVQFGDLDIDAIPDPIMLEIDFSKLPVGIPLPAVQRSNNSLLSTNRDCPHTEDSEWVVKFAWE